MPFPGDPPGTSQTWYPAQSTSNTTVKPTASIAVGTTAVPLTSNTSNPSSALLKLTGASTVYLGGPAVTSATGFPWAATDGPLSFDLGTNEVIYGICAGGTSSTVAVLETGI